MSGSLAAYALVRIRFQVKVAGIITFIVLVFGIIVAVAIFAVPWTVALAVAAVLFFLALSTFVRRFKAAVGNNDIEFWMISNRIMPPIVAVLPIYVMFQQLKLLDTQFALISTYTAVNLPIVVWLTRDFFAGIPIELELRMSVQDSPNSGGVVIDAIRCLKLARDRKIGGPLYSISAYTMKHPPRQIPDDIARDRVEKFISGELER